MAERRMFAKTIVTSDAFLDMPPTARCLYFTLGMFADDDGFVNNPKSIMRQSGASIDDMNILIAKKFVLTFESGVIVIKHWRIHNYIQSDRYHETKYKDEKNALMLDDNKAYTLADTGVPLLDTDCIHDVSIADTEDRLGKDRLGKDRLGKDRLGKDKYKDEFEKLWEIYPRKQGKKKALESYIKARKEGTTYEEVEEGIFAYARLVKAEHRDEQYIKHGSTFFSQRAWLDDFTVNIAPQNKPSGNPFLDMLKGGMFDE